MNYEVSWGRTLRVSRLGAVRDRVLRKGIPVTNGPGAEGTFPVIGSGGWDLECCNADDGCFCLEFLEICYECGPACGRSRTS